MDSPAQCATAPETFDGLERWNDMTPRRKKVTEFSDNGRGPEHWHLNRGVPVIWLIGTIIMSAAQFTGLVWYASQFNTRVDVVEKTVALIAPQLAPQSERMARLEEKLVAVQATTNRIEALLTPVKVR